MLELSEPAALLRGVHHEDVGPAQDVGIELLLARSVGADGRDVGPGREPRGSDERLPGGRAGDDDVGTAHGLLHRPDRDPAHGVRCRGRLRGVPPPHAHLGHRRTHHPQRLHLPACLDPRAEHGDHGGILPAARWRAATPPAAPVRRSVRYPPSRRMASGAPVAASNTITSPSMAGGSCR